MELTYSIIIAARDEADTLPALAHALGQQRVRPLRWVIGESGSSDATVNVAETIVAEYDWARLVVLPATAPRERGAHVVRALHAGLDSLDVEPDVVVNVDAERPYAEAGLDVDRPVHYGSWSGAYRDARQGQDTIVSARH